MSYCTLPYIQVVRCYRPLLAWSLPKEAAVSIPAKAPSSCKWWRPMCVPFASSLVSQCRKLAEVKAGKSRAVTTGGKGEHCSTHMGKMRARLCLLIKRKGHCWWGQRCGQCCKRVRNVPAAATGEEGDNCDCYWKGRRSQQWILVKRDRSTATTASGKGSSTCSE